MSFQGPVKPCNKECVLVFNPKDKTFTIEKLNLSTQVKKLRSAKSASGSSSGNPKHLNVPGNRSAPSPSPLTPNSPSNTHSSSTIGNSATIARMARTTSGSPSSFTHQSNNGNGGSRPRSASPAVSNAGFETSFKPLNVPQNNLLSHSSSGSDDEASGSAFSASPAGSPAAVTGNSVKGKNIANSMGVVGRTGNKGKDESSNSEDELDKEVQRSLNSASPLNPQRLAVAEKAERAPTPLSLSSVVKPGGGIGANTGKKRVQDESSSSSSSSSSDSDSESDSGTNPKKSKTDSSVTPKPLSAVLPEERKPPQPASGGAPPVWQLRKYY